MILAQVDLNDPTDRGLVSGVWRYADGYVPGEPNGGLVHLRESSPARLADYDDSSWDICEDITAGTAKGLCLGWYRMTVTMPDRVEDVPISGKRVFFATTIDDYGELWIDGTCDLAVGQSGHGAISGHNTAQRVLVSEAATPGTRHVIACLAINGPLAQPIGGIFMRYARLEFEDPSRPARPRIVAHGPIERVVHVQVRRHSGPPLGSGAASGHPRT